MASSTTITSLDDPHIHLHSTTPPQYLQRMIMTTLQRKGFETAEAGALAEMERLLENHVQTLFKNAMYYANLSGRSSSNVVDLLQSQSDSGWDSKILRNESRRRRKRIQLETTFEAFDGFEAGLSDIREFLEDHEAGAAEDVKPDIDGGEARGRRGKKGRVPDYAYDGVPSLPGTWTHPASQAAPDLQDIPTGSAQLHVTQASLEFVKITAAERGDIDPALGIVDYRRSGFGGQGKSGKRKWGVRGVEVV